MAACLKHGSELAEYLDRRNREEQEMLEMRRKECRLAALVAFVYIPVR